MAHGSLVSYGKQGYKNAKGKYGRMGNGSNSSADRNGPIDKSGGNNFSRRKDGEHVDVRTGKNNQVKYGAKEKIPIMDEKLKGIIGSGSRFDNLHKDMDEMMMESGSQVNNKNIGGQLQKDKAILTEITNQIISRNSALQEKVTDEADRNTVLKQFLKDLNKAADNMKCNKMKLQLRREQKELFWKEKSRNCWLKEGDKNTTFFHLSTVIRRRRNKLEGFKGEDGSWTREIVLMKKEAVGYFQKLFEMKQSTGEYSDLPLMFPKLNACDISSLSNAMSEQELKQSIFNIGGLKAPGPDGFPPSSSKNIGIVVKMIYLN
ncbi:hypothetical protein Ddye_023973 [Dipteronia dyeriana]|uniref:Uncharacterized protein n=1 Tax=Dipteronia dyeriana TaxID=168575 RepID=A0AAD9WTX6_9ROSI|nr:hypothetical protein Ddye_023973 [Dipteronia dyeriana]